MDFESPDVQKEFPGLYASDAGRRSNESDFSDGGDHDKPSRKDLLIGRRKDKKESKKDRGYAALEGDSSPEEELDTKSPSKSKKMKSFKFPSKSKEKREKSRDKEKVNEKDGKEKEHCEKEKKKEKEKEKKEKEKKEKLKEKDKEKEEKLKVKEAKEKVKEVKEKVKEVKEKGKEAKEAKVKEKDKEKVKEKDKEKVKEKDKEKIKEKDKDKKEKKSNKIPTGVTGVPFEEIFTIGVALPIFGVPLHTSVERSRCHDDTSLPLVVRNALDYIQENGFKSENLYRIDADKVRLQQLERLYTEREAIFPYHWDVSTACALLRKFLSELPEPILTYRFIEKFEEIALQQNETHTETKLIAVIEQLPTINRTLIGWLVTHFANVLAHEKENHLNLQLLSAIMAPPLKISTNLLYLLIIKAKALFPDILLKTYVPPLPTLGPNLPDTAFEITAELRKQESLLSQIHAEMHAGFVTQKREEQLWEGQRIVTQLKRKLRSVQKSVEPHTTQTQSSLDERQNTIDEDNVSERSKSASDQPSKVPSRSSDDDITKKHITRVITSAEVTSAVDAFKVESSPEKREMTGSKQSLPAFEDNFDDADTNVEEPAPAVEPSVEITAQVVESIQEKPQLSEQESMLMRLQLEHAEFLHLKSILQAKINAEKFEIVKLRTQTALKNKQDNNHNGSKEVTVISNYSDADKEEMQRLANDNALLEHKRLNLVSQIFQTRLQSMQMRIQLAMNEILSPVQIREMIGTNQFAQRREVFGQYDSVFTPQSDSNHPRHSEPYGKPIVLGQGSFQRNHNSYSSFREPRSADFRHQRKWSDIQNPEDDITIRIKQSDDQAIPRSHSTTDYSQTVRRQRLSKLRAEFLASNLHNPEDLTKPFQRFGVRASLPVERNAHYKGPPQIHKFPFAEPFSTPPPVKRVTVDLGSPDAESNPNEPNDEPQVDEAPAQIEDASPEVVKERFEQLRKEYAPHVAPTNLQELLPPTKPRAVPQVPQAIKELRDSEEASESTVQIVNHNNNNNHRRSQSDFPNETPKPPPPVAARKSEDHTNNNPSHNPAYTKPKKRGFFQRLFLKSKKN